MLEIFKWGGKGNHELHFGCILPQSPLGRLIGRKLTWAKNPLLLGRRAMENERAPAAQKTLSTIVGNPNFSKLPPPIFIMGNAPLEEKTSLKRKDGFYELPEPPTDIVCPACGELGITFNRTFYKLPDGDEILIINITCEKCGYKRNELVPLLNAFQPGIYRLTVDDADFTHKVFRGATGDLDIPEIGVSIERGPAASFDLTNVEGILLKMEEQLAFFLETTPKDTREWINGNEAYKRLKKALDGGLNFTVILRDLDGGSYITPTNPQKMTFSPVERSTDTSP